MGLPDLSGLNAVVTGGGRGIGRAVAESLAAAGAAVVVSARNQEQIGGVAADLSAAGARAFACPCDVASAESVAELARFSANKLGQVDILINNAGIAASAALKSQTLEEWNRVMAVNATGTFLCTQAFAVGMAERGFGRVVNVASIAARTGAPYIAAYTASKHAVLGFTRAVAAELAAKGVTVNAVCPGYVDTDMTEDSIANVMKRTTLNRDEALAAILKSAGQKRLVTVEEVAYMTLMLCGRAAGATTGQALVIDGGGLFS